MRLIVLALIILSIFGCSKKRKKEPMLIADPKPVFIEKEIVTPVKVEEKLKDEKVVAKESPDFFGETVYAR